MISIEKHKDEFQLEDVILGGQDGLVNVLGVVLGVAAASSDPRLVLAAGLAATFAESLSMAAVAYTSKMAKADFYEAELEREQREIEEVPEAEVEEVREIYRKRGFADELLEQVTQKIVANKKVWLEVMMHEELNLEEISRAKVLRSALLVGLSAMIGSFLPLLPFFFFPIALAVPLALLLSALALVLLGAYKAQVTVGRPWRSGLQLALIGIVSALAGYVVGMIFKAPADF